MAVDGFSRHDLPGWQLIVKALSNKARQMIMVEDFLENRLEISRNQRMREKAATFTRKVFKRGRGLRGVVDVRTALR